MPWHYPNGYFKAQILLHHSVDVYVDMLDNIVEIEVQSFTHLTNSLNSFHSIFVSFAENRMLDTKKAYALPSM